MARKFKTYRNENGGEVQAHVVTDDTAGEVRTLAGVQQVAPGDRVVSTDNPYYVDVVSRGADWPYKEVQDTEEERTVDGFHSLENTERNDGAFDPNNETAEAVKRYLESDDVSDEEKARVTAAERAGRNRSSAFPRR